MMRRGFNELKEFKIKCKVSRSIKYRYSLQLTGMCITARWAGVPSKPRLSLNPGLHSVCKSCRYIKTWLATVLSGRVYFRVAKLAIGVNKFDIALLTPLMSGFGRGIALLLFMLAVVLLAKDFVLLKILLLLFMDAAWLLATPFSGVFISSAVLADMLLFAIAC